MSEKLSEGAEMSSASQAIERSRQGVVYLAGDGPLKARIRRVREYLDGVCTDRRVKGYLYYETREVLAHEAEAIEAAVQQKCRKEMNRLRAQIAALEVQQRHDLDAMAAQLPILLGPLYPHAVAAGLVNPEAVAAQEDGEAK